MSLPRTKLWLVVWALAVLAAAPAPAQDIRDMQLFAPAENDHFGEGMRANQGAFFQFEGLYWWIQAPDVTDIGNDGMQRIAYLTPSRILVQENTHDTCDLAADGVSGTRWEFGYIHRHDGIMFSIYNMAGQGQRLAYGPSDVVIDDRDVGPFTRGRLEGLVAEYDGSEYIYDPNPVKLPIRFDELLVKNDVKTWGVEAEYMYRSHAGPHGGIWELLLGARYIKFEETFSVEGYGDQFLREAGEDEAEDEEGTPLGPNAILADSLWFAGAENHIVGPQIGLRLFNQTERWTWESSVRFLSGLNIQNLNQGGNLGSELDQQFFTEPAEEEDAGVILFQPLDMVETSFNHCKTKYEWSPAIELRLNLRYQLTHAVGLRVGWTGIWLDNIARASNLVDYTFYETQFMGILEDENRQSVFMHGVTFGVDINR